VVPERRIESASQFNGTPALIFVEPVEVKYFTIETESCGARLGKCSTKFIRIKGQQRQGKIKAGRDPMGTGPSNKIESDELLSRAGVEHRMGNCLASRLLRQSLQRGREALRNPPLTQLPPARPGSEQPSNRGNSNPKSIHAPTNSEAAGSGPGRRTRIQSGNYRASPFDPRLPSAPLANALGSCPRDSLRPVLAAEFSCLVFFFLACF